CLNSTTRRRRNAAQGSSPCGLLDCTQNDGLTLGCAAAKTVALDGRTVCPHGQYWQYEGAELLWPYSAFSWPGLWSKERGYTPATSGSRGWRCQGSLSNGRRQPQ